MLASLRAIRAEKRPSVRSDHRRRIRARFERGRFARAATAPLHRPANARLSRAVPMPKYSTDLGPWPRQASALPRQFAGRGSCVWPRAARDQGRHSPVSQRSPQRGPIVRRNLREPPRGTQKTPPAAQIVCARSRPPQRPQHDNQVRRALRHERQEYWGPHCGPAQP